MTLSLTLPQGHWRPARKQSEQIQRNPPCDCDLYGTEPRRIRAFFGCGRWRNFRGIFSFHAWQWHLGYSFYFIYWFNVYFYLVLFVIIFYNFYLIYLLFAGGNLEIQAASLLYKINIIIYQLDQPRWEVVNFADAKTRTIQLSYVKNRSYAGFIFDN